MTDGVLGGLNCRRDQNKDFSEKYILLSDQFRLDYLLVSYEKTRVTHSVHRILRRRFSPKDKSRRHTYLFFRRQFCYISILPQDMNL